MLGARRLRESQAPAGRRRRRPEPSRRRAAGRDREASSRVDPLSVEVGYALVALVDEKQGGTLLDARARHPPADRAPRPAWSCRRCTSPTTCSSGRATYAILVKGVEVARGELYTDRLLAINPGTASRPLDGVATREPAFGLPARLDRDRAARQRHRGRLHRRRSDDRALDAPVGDHPHVPARAADAAADQGADRPRRADVAEAGRGAGAEAVVARRRAARAAAAAARARAGARSHDDSRSDGRRRRRSPRIPTSIIEAVRAALGRAICRPYQNEQGRAAGHRRRAGARGALLASIVRTDQGAVLALDPQRAQSLASPDRPGARRGMAQPVLLCSPTLRPHLWRLFSRALPHIGVLSHNEVPAHMRIVPCATLD